MVRSDPLHCEKIVRRNARTLALASYFLPAKKRRASFALYSFRRSADDIVDACGPDRKAIARNLLEHRRALTEAIDGRPRGPVLRELRWAMREFDISSEVLFDLLDRVSRGANPPTWSSWEDLEKDCEIAAETVGTICTRICGIPGGPRQEQLALSHARTLGVAMQLTNILRDVGEDAKSGQCHLPDEELARFSLERDDVIGDPAIAQDPRWHRLMTFEIERARALYDRALPGISMLAEDSQRCAAACAIGYAAILDALENIHYDSVSSRASIGTFARIGVLWDAWRFKAKARAMA